MKRVVSALAIAMLCGGAAPIQNENLAPFQVLSYGVDSCGKFIAASQAEKSMYIAWTIGFISGANSRDTGSGRLAGQGWDQPGVTLWLKNYCNANPLKLFVGAVTDLRASLGGHAN
jgi:hypothetical protein